MTKNIGLFLLLAVCFVFLSSLTYTIFEVGNVESVSSYVSKTFSIREETFMNIPTKSSSLLIEENKDFIEKENDYNNKNKDNGVNDYESSDQESGVVNSATNIIKKSFDRILEFPSELSFFNKVQDTYYSSNLSVNVGEQYGLGSGGSFFAPSISEEKFAVFSSELGLIDSKRMEVKQSFSLTASNDFSNPLGADTFGVLRNSQLEVKRRLVMQSGFTDNYKLIYTIKNNGGPFFKDKTKFNLSLRETFVSPSFADLDTDGDFDMVVGCLKGTVYYFENVGDKYNFNFVLRDTFENSSDSNLFSNVFAHFKYGTYLGPHSSPSFADLDSDGDLDLVMGTNQEYVGYFENVGSASVPSWINKDSSFAFLDGEMRESIDFADFDSDNDLDMIVGGYISSTSNFAVEYYENNGSATSMSWNKVYTFNSSEPVYDATITDFDNDGDLDVLVSGKNIGSNDVRFLNNTAGVGIPRFKESNPFSIDHGSMLSSDLYNDIYIDTADLDDDGLEDLIIGNTNKNNGTFSFYKRNVNQDLKLTDVYFYEFPLFRLGSGNYNSSVYYDSVSDSFVTSWKYNSYPRASVVFFSNLPSAMHGIQSVNWYYPNTIVQCGDKYDNSEDMYWVDGKLNGLNFYDPIYAFNSSISCYGYSDYFTKFDVSPILGVYLGNFSVGEEKSVEFTFKFGLDGIQRSSPDLLIKDIRFSKDNISFSLVNSGGLSVLNPVVKISELDDTGIIKFVNFSFNSSIKEFSNINFSVPFNVSSKHKVVLVADPSDVVVESDENNNLAEAIKKPNNVFIVVNMSSLSPVFEEYLKNKLANYNFVSSESDADYRLFIGGERFNDLTLSKGFGVGDGFVKFYSQTGFFPYNGFVNVVDKDIFVRGAGVDGVVAALKYVDWANLDNSKHFVGKGDIEGLKVFDFFRTNDNKPFLYSNSSQFNTIVKQALSGKFVEENISIKTLQGVELRLKHLGNKNSVLFKSYLGLPDYPIVMAGGLWSDVETWRVLGQELSDSGRDVWLAEITGGPFTECDTCADYSYQDLVDYHVPAIIGGVVALSNKSQIQWVGHSNGGRSALDFLTSYQSIGKNPSGLYWTGSSYEYSSFQPNVVETYVGAGVPGAFEGWSPFSRCMYDHGNEMLSKIPENQNHISQKETGKRLLLEWPFDPYCVLIGTKMKDENKISMKLTDQYYSWINSTTDSQPGTGFSIDNAKIIYGYKDFNTNTDSDLIVPIQDDIDIYTNINAINKYINSSKIMHQQMVDNKKVQQQIKEVINK